MEKTKAKLEKRWKMINKGREMLVKNLDKIKEKVTGLKGKEPTPESPPQQVRLLKGDEPTKRERFAQLETQIEKLKTLNADDSALNEEAKAKQATCMKTIVETRVKLWCLACANKEFGKELDTTNIFSSNGVLVRQETCEALITDCGQVFAFMRRLRETDKIMRKAKATSEVPPPKRVLEGEDLEIEDNTDEDLDGDKACVDNIAECKSNTGKR